MSIGTMKAAARRAAKYAIIRGGLEAVAWSGAARLMPKASGRGVIFTLHHVRPATQPDFDPNGLLAITPQFLDAAIVTAREAGLHPVRLDELPSLLADPTDDRRFVAFTLDDGYRDNAEYGAPIFRRHGVPYTIFITPGFVERTRTIWWETAEALLRSASTLDFDFGNGLESVAARSRLQKLAAFDRLAHFVQTTDEDQAVAAIDAAARAAGIDPVAIVESEIMNAAELATLSSDRLAHLGAHTLTHPNLARVSPERLKREIEGSAAQVAAYSGVAPRAFAFPYGGRNAAGEREAAAAAAAGFAVAVTTQPAALRPENRLRPTALPRVSLNGQYQRPRFVKALLSGIPFQLMK